MSSTATCRDELLARLEQQVGIVVRRGKRMVGERARAVHPDLMGASYLLLVMLAQEGPIRASSMAEEFGIDKGAISRQLQNLEELGLVVRTPDPADGRATLVSASPQAVRRLEGVSKQRRSALGDRLAGWTPEELAAFTDQLERYNRAFCG